MENHELIILSILVVFKSLIDQNLGCDTPTAKLLQSQTPWPGSGRLIHIVRLIHTVDLLYWSCWHLVRHCCFITAEGNWIMQLPTCVFKFMCSSEERSIFLKSEKTTLRVKSLACGRAWWLNLELSCSEHLLDSVWRGKSLLPWLMEIPWDWEVCIAPWA